MATEDDERTHLPELQTILDAGSPLVTHEVDLPMEVHREATTGAIVIDSACLAVSGLDKAGVLRLRFSPLAAKTLKRALDILETTPDERISPDKKPSTH
ncbi:MAG: hypothetical protein E6R10_07160 [Rhodocyclaceae bacterium]|nr:MAG: hypothetical protein E6R10_07160 [Rhodocyclaceae bacterium]